MAQGASRAGGVYAGGYAAARKGGVGAQRESAERIIEKLGAVVRD